MIPEFISYSNLCGLWSASCIVCDQAGTDQAVLYLAGTSGGNSLRSCKWPRSLTFSSEPVPSYLASAGLSRIALLLLLYYLRYTKNFCSKRSYSLRIFKKITFHLEITHFTQFYKTVLNIVAGIFISLAIDLHLGLQENSLSESPDSWILPEILPGYALFGFVWCLICWVLCCCCTPK